MDGEHGDLKMVVESQLVGFKPGEWPQTFEWAHRTWTKERTVAAKDGDVQFVEYVADDGKWIVIYPPE